MRERTTPPTTPPHSSPPPNSYLAGGSGSGPAFALLFAPAILGSKFHCISFHFISPGDARVLILACTDGLGRATADYVGLTALFPFSVRFSLFYREPRARVSAHIIV